MRTITLIYDGTFNTYRWLKAMMWARNEFHDLGYKIKKEQPEQLLSEWFFLLNI